VHKLLMTAGMLGLIVFSGPVLGDAAQHLPMCSGCHGADGASSAMPDAPIIAGIAAEVQEDALFAIQDGGRTCAPPGVMCQVAASLSEDDIAELAAHFAEMPFKPAGEAFDAALAAKGEEIHENNCGICHGIHEPGDPQASIIHGQKIAYLRHVMQQYAAGERDQLPPMQAAISALTPEDIEALVNFYASYRKGSE
jgi:cytochrome subunit of sulfide dehydrogenase